MKTCLPPIYRDIFQHAFDWRWCATSVQDHPEHAHTTNLTIPHYGMVILASILAACSFESKCGQSCQYLFNVKILSSSGGWLWMDDYYTRALLIIFWTFPGNNSNTKTEQCHLSSIWLMFLSGSRVLKVLTLKLSGEQYWDQNHNWTCLVDYVEGNNRVAA